MAHWERPEWAHRCSYQYRCSECKQICHQVTGNCGRKEKDKVPNPECSYRYCPWCGAKMEF